MDMNPSRVAIAARDMTTLSFDPGGPGAFSSVRMAAPARDAGTLGPPPNDRGKATYNGATGVKDGDAGVGLIYSPNENKLIHDEDRWARGRTPLTRAKADLDLEQDGRTPNRRDACTMPNDAVAGAKKLGFDVGTVDRGATSRRTTPLTCAGHMGKPMNSGVQRMARGPNDPCEYLRTLELVQPKGDAVPLGLEHGIRPLGSDGNGGDDGSTTGTPTTPSRRWGRDSQRSSGASSAGSWSPLPA